MGNGGTGREERGKEQTKRTRDGNEDRARAKRSWGRERETERGRQTETGRVIETDWQRERRNLRKTEKRGKGHTDRQRAVRIPWQCSG